MRHRGVEEKESLREKECGLLASATTDVGWLISLMSVILKFPDTKLLLTVGWYVNLTSHAPFGMETGPRFIVPSERRLENPAR